MNKLMSVKTVRVLGVIFLLAQLADISTTWIGINYLGAVELNPIMAPIVNTWLMPVIKMSIGILMPLFATWMISQYHDVIWRTSICLTLVFTTMVATFPPLWNGAQLWLLWMVR